VHGNGKAIDTKMARQLEAHLFSDHDTMKIQRVVTQPNAEGEMLLHAFARSGMGRTVNALLLHGTPV
jgi:hypothetical protein